MKGRRYSFSRKNLRGFTLIEMVVVITIIGVLAAIIVPSVMNYIRKAQRRVDTANAKQMYSVVMMLLADQDLHTLDQSDKYGNKAFYHDVTNDQSFYLKPSGAPAFDNVEVYHGGSNVPEKYKLQVVAKMTGSSGEWGGKKRYKWVSGTDEHRVFVQSLNDTTCGGSGGSFVGDSSQYKWPMKYVSHKGGYITDQWLICYSNIDYRVEIWTGNSAKTGNSGPMYRVWPDPCDEYNNSFCDNPYQKANENYKWCGTIGKYDKNHFK